MSINKAWTRRTPITITQRKLLSLALEVCSQVRDSTITCRVTNKDFTTAQNLFQEEEEYEQSIFLQSVLPQIQRAIAVHRRALPEGSIVIKDPIEMCYRTLEPGEIPDPNQLRVAMDSSAVRSVHALVDSTQKICILDP